MASAAIAPVSAAAATSNTPGKEREKFVHADDAGEREKDLRNGRYDGGHGDDGGSGVGDGAASAPSSSSSSASRSAMAH